MLNGPCRMHAYQAGLFEMLSLLAPRPRSAQREQFFPATDLWPDCKAVGPHPEFHAGKPLMDFTASNQQVGGAGEHFIGAVAAHDLERQNLPSSQIFGHRLTTAQKKPQPRGWARGSSSCAETVPSYLPCRKHCVENLSAEPISGRPSVVVTPCNRLARPHAGCSWLSSCRH
jgi:hypothetical protein